MSPELAELVLAIVKSGFVIVTLVVISLALT
jgi:hypothetical protein